jgi:hypothetical protein
MDSDLGMKNAIMPMKISFKCTCYTIIWQWFETIYL